MDMETGGAGLLMGLIILGSLVQWVGLVETKFDFLNMRWGKFHNPNKSYMRLGYLMQEKTDFHVYWSDFFQLKSVRDCMSVLTNFK